MTGPHWADAMALVGISPSGREVAPAHVALRSSGRGFRGEDLEEPGDSPKC